MAEPDVKFERYWVVARSAEEAARILWAWSASGAGEDKVFLRRLVAEEAADQADARVYCCTEHVCRAG